MMGRSQWARSMRVSAYLLLFVTRSITAANLRTKADFMGRRNSATTRSLYFQRSSTLEDFILACESSLHGSQINQHDFTSFLVKYCATSSSKGNGCPMDEIVPFSSLPLELQLSFVECPGATTYEQIDCLRHLVETSESLLYKGEADALCARSFPLMKSTGFLHNEGQNEEPWSKLDVSFSPLEYKGPYSEESTKASISKAAKKKSDHEVSSAPTVSPRTMQPSSSPTNGARSAAPILFFEEPILQATLSSIEVQTHSPTEAPVAQIVQVPFRSEQQSDQYTLHPMAFIGAAAAGTLVILALVSRGLKRKRARDFGAVLDPALTGDASISSEPSQVFNLLQDDDKQDAEERRLSISSFALFRFFQKTKSLPEVDPLAACRATSHFQWTTKAIDSLDSVTSYIKKRKLSGSVKSTSNLGIAPFPRGSNHEEEESMAQHGSDDLLHSPGHATHSSDSDSEDGGTEHGYFLDIDAIDTAPESTLTDSSEDDRPREKSRTKPLARSRFLFGGKLSSRKGKDDAGSFRSVGSSDSQSLASYSREALHEDEALGDLECSSSFRNNGKPWRNALAMATGDSYSIETNSVDKVEEGLSFLSPDVLKQFEEVDQRLSDGLKQLQDQDQKLSDEMDRIAASMSNNTASPNKVEQYDYEDDFSHSSDNWDGDIQSVSACKDAQYSDQGEVRPHNAIITTPSTVASTLNLEPDDDEAKLIRVTNLNDGISFDAQEDDVSSDEEEKRFAFSRLRDRFESKWQRNAEYNGACLKPELQYSLAESKREALIAATSSSLLNPGVTSEDEG